MPVFCSNCGAQVSGTGKFCSSCGSALQAQSQPGSNPPQPPLQPQQPATPGAPVSHQGPATTTQAKKSGGALKVVLIAFGVIAVLVVVFIVGLGMLLKKAFVGNITVKEKPGRQAEVSIAVPGGRLKVTENPQVTEENLGVPIYPGAKVVEDSGSVRFSGGAQKGSATIGGASFTTRDPVNAVVEFYKAKLGKQVNIVESTSEGKHVVVLNVVSDKGWKTITVEDEGNGVTKVAIATMSGSRTQ